MKFYLPVTWEMCGTAVVEADTIELAIEIFKDNVDVDGDGMDIDGSDFIEGSIRLSSEDTNELLTKHMEARACREVDVDDD